jgi:hypothetical protein
VTASKEYVEIMARLMAGQKQQQFWKALLEVGEEFTTVDWNESKKLSDKFRCQLKACFHNCAKIAACYRSLTYCADYASNIIPVEHAWLVDRKGTVIDPTYYILDRNTADYFGVRIRYRKDRLPDDRGAPQWLPTVEKHLALQTVSNIL